MSNTAQENATITVSYDNISIIIPLDGVELSAVVQSDGSTHRYLSNASRDWIGNKIEKALIELATTP